MEDSGDWMCEAWNEVGEATQTVRVTIKGNEYYLLLKILID
jgi:hypothetical protein